MPAHGTNIVWPALAVTATALLALSCAAQPPSGSEGIQVGPRPYYLVDQLEEGALKTKLERCKDGPFYRTDFSIGHRGACLQYPEHSRESYAAAARMGAGIVECDVTFTRDRQLVCRHSQCDLHYTTDILLIPELAAKCTQPFTPADPTTGTPASAKCCTSDITLAEFKSLCARMEGLNPGATTVEEFLAGTPGWRTDLNATCGTVMSHAESIELFEELGVKSTPELKSPEVDMPYEGDYTQEMYAQQLIDEYVKAGVDPGNVWPQSFQLSDVLYWIRNEPEFGAQGVYLDGRYETSPGFDPNDPQTWTPSMTGLRAQGVNVVAPPLWVLVTLDDDGKIVPSAYAREARAAGLDIITWTLERSGPLAAGGGWYYQSIADAIDDDGDTLVLLDVLARDVGVVGVFSDWPGTVTYYANCILSTCPTP